SNSGTPDDDVWFSFMAANTTQNLTLANTSGNTDIYFQVFSSSCSGTMTSILCSDTNSGGSITGLTVGNTYYVRVYTYSSAVVTTGTICITNPAPSGPGDECTNSINIGASGVNYTHTLCDGTGCQPNEDASPSNIASEFCGFLDNLVWFDFIASSASACFNMTSSSPSNLQVDILNVSGNVCTGTWTHAGSTACLNPPSWTANTLTNVCFNGLTSGTKYYLVFDNFSGSTTDITLQASSGVLPISLVSLKGYKNTDNTNTIEWQTSSEINNSHFEIERSIDGENFESLTRVNGKGNNVGLINYSTVDNKPMAGLNYYRLVQYDYDGNIFHSDKIAVLNMNNNNGVVLINPNPASNKINYSFVSENRGGATVQVLDVTGNVISTQKISVVNGENSLELSLESLNKGIYILQITDDETRNSMIRRFVKE
nr:T9SS type A sorting domain-containing protein [Saprospiraceae bacterium]